MVCLTRYRQWMNLHKSSLKEIIDLHHLQRYRFTLLKVGSQRDMITSSKVIYLPDGRFTVHFKNHDDEDKITCSTAHEAARKCVEFIEKYYGDEPGEKTSLFISKRLEPVSNISRYMPT